MIFIEMVFALVVYLAMCMGWQWLTGYTDVPVDKRGDVVL